MSRARKERRDRARAVHESPATVFRREMFRGELRDFLQLPNVRVVRHLAPDQSCVCVLASDFDPADNDLWELEPNKGQVRDVVCAVCAGQVVMSNWMFGEYSAMPVKPVVVCHRCFQQQLESLAADPAG